MGEAHLWKGGRVFTGASFEEAALVEGAEFVSVGSLASVERDSPTGTEVHDLQGGLLVPGLIDAHLHLAEFLLRSQAVDLATARSVPELVERAAQWAMAHPQGPVVGAGWFFPSLSQREWPSRAEMDRISVERPVVMYHASGHAASVNSVALDRMGIGRGSADPPGGRIGRDPQGEPDGRLFERALERAVPLSHAVLVTDPAFVETTLARLTAFGITSVGSMNVDPIEAGVLSTAEGRGRLNLRVRVFLSLSWFKGLDDDDIPSLVPSSPRLRVVGVKAFADGAFGSRTAWLDRPYEDEPGTSGIPVHTVEEMREAFRRARRLGLTPAVHALGDRGVDAALRALAPSPSPETEGLPPRLEHAGLIPPSFLPELRRLRPVTVVQPAFVWSDDWLVQRLGRSRIRYAYPFRALRDAGCPLAGSSDAPFDRLDPWIGIRAAVRRADPHGASANPDPAQALSIEEALEMYTLGGARAIGEPNLGRIARGAPADFLWLAASELEPAILSGARGIRETWIEGRPVFQGALSGAVR